MRKWKRVSRRKRILRNCLLIAVALMLLWVAGGLSPLTKEGFVREVQRKNLLSGGEIIYEARCDGTGYRHTMYINCDDVVIQVHYSSYDSYHSYVREKQDGVVLISMSDKNGLIVMGDLENVASGILEVPMEDHRHVEPVVHTFVANGAKENDNVISFTVTAETYEQEYLLSRGLNFNTQQYALRLYDEAGGLVGTWTNVEEQEGA